MILQQIRQRAAQNIQHILLPEGEDIRTVQAAEMCIKDRIAKITIIGSEEKVRELALTANVNLNGVEILDHRKSKLRRFITNFGGQKAPRSKNRNKL
jgi:phosphotransacetylase